MAWASAQAFPWFRDPNSQLLLAAIPWPGGLRRCALWELALSSADGGSGLVGGRRAVIRVAVASSGRGQSTFEARSLKRLITEETGLALLLSIPPVQHPWEASGLSVLTLH